jgi:hypothetical protein
MEGQMKNLNPWQRELLVVVGTLILVMTMMAAIITVTTFTNPISAVNIPQQVPVRQLPRSPGRPAEGIFGDLFPGMDLDQPEHPEIPPAGPSWVTGLGTGGMGVLA